MRAEKSEMYAEGSGVEEQRISVQLECGLQVDKRQLQFSVWVRDLHYMITEDFTYADERGSLTVFLCNGKTTNMPRLFLQVLLDLQFLLANEFESLRLQ